MGCRKKTLNESVGLTRSLSSAHWFLERTSIAIIKQFLEMFKELLKTCLELASLAFFFVLTQFHSYFLPTFDKLLLIIKFSF